MKQIKICFYMITVICLLTATAFAAAQTMSVQVRSGQVRSTPSFMGKVVADLGYGDQVVRTEEQGGWIKVQVPGRGIEGWMHGSALSSKKIELKAGTANVKQTASGQELALAGKGFNKQVENEFRAKHPNMDFTWIDRMEKFQVSTNEMQRFLEHGGLR
jgi:hypothetical protein